MQTRSVFCARYAELIKAEGLEVQIACTWPSWQSGMNAAVPFKDAADNSTVIDETCLARRDSLGQGRGGFPWMVRGGCLPERSAEWNHR